MAEGLIEDTTLWAEIEDTDADSIAMRFIADNIASWFDMFNRDTRVRRLLPRSPI